MKAEHPRVRELTGYFDMVLAERMSDVPIINTRLDVEAVGFEFAARKAEKHSSGGDDTDSATAITDPLITDPLHGYDGAIGEGVLITPWFMSLVRLPAEPFEAANFSGSKCTRSFGAEQFEFLGHQEEGRGALPGYFETCALFSPMTEFADQSFARQTAQHVLEMLRTETAQTQPAPGRRAFLTGGQSRRAAA